MIGDALRTAAYPPPSKKAGGRCTYEVTLLWLPPRPEDSISGLISGLPSEPASSRRGSLDTLESFDLQALISRAPTPKQTSRKRQISEATYPPERASTQPRDRPLGRRLNSGPSIPRRIPRRKELQTLAPARVAGQKGLNSAIEVQTAPWNSSLD